MDPTNRVIYLCVKGSRAEFEGHNERAHGLYQEAWQAAENDYEACIAAHYLARHQDNPDERLRWNQIALDRANATKDHGVEEFYPSLYVNLGHSYELLGRHAEAQRYYDLAAAMGLIHQTERAPARPRNKS